MQKYTSEILTTNKTLRDEFFLYFDRFIVILKKNGHIRSAIIHKKNRDHYYAEVTLLD